jgi:hypothetical protein
MRVHAIPTQPGYIFACSRRAIDACFERGQIEWISFGAIGKHFEFDRKDEHRPALSGTVVAALTWCPDERSYLCLYPVREDLYADHGKSSFADIVLPRFRTWLGNAQQLPHELQRDSDLV